MWRLIGIGIIGAIVAGIAIYYTSSAENGYSSKAVNTINNVSDEMDDIFRLAESNVDSCIRGSQIACNDFIKQIDKGAGALDKAYTNFLALQPPPSAESWHRDYLQVIVDYRDTFRALVTAWDRGNIVAFEAALARLDKIGQREEGLVSYFNANLR